MPRLSVVLLSLVLGAASAALISCGSDGGGNIPATKANAMLAQLSTASADAADGDCTGVREAAKNLSGQAGTLTDGELRIAIQKGAASLAQLAANPDNCQTTTKETTTEEEPTTSTSIPTTSTTTKPKPKPTTTTTTRSTTQTTTATQPPKPPPSGGGGTGPGGGGTGVGGGN